MHIRNQTSGPIGAFESQAPYLATKMGLDGLELVITEYEPSTAAPLKHQPQITTTHDNNQTVAKLNTPALHALDEKNGIVDYVLALASTREHALDRHTKDASKLPIERAVFDGYHAFIATAHLHELLGDGYVTHFSDLRRRRMHSAQETVDATNSPQEQTRYALIAAIDALDGKHATNQLTAASSRFIYSAYETAGNNAQHAEKLLSHAASLYAQIDIERTLTHKHLHVRDAEIKAPRGNSTLKAAAHEIRAAYDALTKNARKAPASEIGSLISLGTSYN